VHPAMRDGARPASPGAALRTPRFGLVISARTWCPVPAHIWDVKRGWLDGLNSSVDSQRPQSSGGRFGASRTRRVVVTLSAKTPRQFRGGLLRRPPLTSPLG
jgi:hypothetical protein